MYDSLSFVRRASQIGTVLYTRLFGRVVGQDAFGNSYYEQRRMSSSGRSRRWVMYAAEPEATLVPPYWFAWLHHQTDVPPVGAMPALTPCAKPHIPNLTGTNAAYLPDGHMLNSVGKCDCDSACDSDYCAYHRWVP